MHRNHPHDFLKSHFLLTFMFMWVLTPALTAQDTFSSIDFPGAILTQVAGVSPDGAIVGRYEDSSGTIHGFLSLPAEIPDEQANRDLDGVRACILGAVWKAQGKACGPGFLGVAIGGDRASGYEFAKHQLLRAVDDSSPGPALAELEARIMKEAHGVATLNPYE